MDSEAAEVELPHAIALAWGIAANPQRGPKRELSIERIVDVAVEIADESGLASVSMSSVAAALGFTTMSLYRYVTAKDDLILLMQERGLGLPPLSVSEAPGWREGLAAFSRETLAIYAVHPWMLDVPIAGIPNTPNNLAWLDAALTAMRETPLSDLERVSAVLLVTGHARWQGLIERGYHERSRQTGVAPTENDRADAHVIRTLVTEDMFPALYPIVRSGAFTDESDDTFGFGLGRILDGLAQHIEEIAAGTPAAREEPASPPETYPKDEAVAKARQARREAEQRLREARKKEQDAILNARERERREAEKAVKRG